MLKKILKSKERATAEKNCHVQHHLHAHTMGSLNIVTELLLRSQTGIDSRKVPCSVAERIFRKKRPQNHCINAENL